MLYVEQALHLMFAADADIVTEIGDRLYALTPPQHVTYPYTVRVLMGREVLEVYETPGRCETARSRFRFISEARGRETGYGPAKRADEAIRLMIEGFKGTVTDGGSPESTIEMLGAKLIDSREIYSDEDEIHSIVSEYLITHTQPIRTS